MLTRLAVLAALAASTACTGFTRPTGDRSFSVTPDHNAGRTRDVLTASELRTADSRSTLDAIRMLRPEFLFATRGPLDSPPQVYLDGVYQGDLSALRTVPIEVIVEVRYLRSSVASDQFGPYRRRGPVISVRTRG